MNKKLMLVFSVAVLTGCVSGVSADRSTRAEVCEPISETEVASLFDRWNESLQTGNSELVVNNYAKHSILLPTLSDKNRISQEEKEDYFTHFLSAKPVGTVTARQINIGCNMATDSGLYTFAMGSTGEQVHARYTYVYRWENGQWLIASHHSSLLPKH